MFRPIHLASFTFSSYIGLSPLSLLLDLNSMFLDSKAEKMAMIKINSTEGKKFIEEVNRRLAISDPESQKPVSVCYQCGKCSAGCPTAYEMDYPPNQIIRLVQLGQMEIALRSNAIWRCASCETCSTRCPQDVDIAGVMNTLRIMARDRGYVEPEKDVATFDKIFLNSIRKHGQIFESGMVAAYNFKSGHLFQDALKGSQMMLKGKLPLLPHNHDQDRIKKIFQKVAEKKALERK